MAEEFPDFEIQEIRELKECSEMQNTKKSTATWPDFKRLLTLCICCCCCLPLCFAIFWWFPVIRQCDCCRGCHGYHLPVASFVVWQLFFIKVFTIDKFKEQRTFNPVRLLGQYL